MEPRYGRLYASAVLRPLAEQVIDALGVQRGEIACDLMCDAQRWALHWVRRWDSRGGLCSSTATRHCSSSQRKACRRLGARSRHWRRPAWSGHPMRRRLIGSRRFVLTVSGTATRLLDVAEGVSRRRATVLTWDAAEPPAHEIALTDALRDIARIDSPFLRRCLDCPDANRASPWEPVILRDVVQFDGIAAYWAAMVLERPLRREFDKLPGDEVAAVRSACQRALQRWTAADGTMRIPVRATLWCLRPA